MTDLAYDVNSSMGLGYLFQFAPNSNLCYNKIGCLKRINASNLED
jgi:hypothetical protein